MRLTLAPAFVLFILAACTDPPGEITRDSKPFAEIDESATISLLGTEPFWSLDIAPQEDAYEARYSTPDNIDGTAFAVTRFAGNNGLGFSGELGGQPVQASITPGQCSDAMSDRTYPYVATLAIDGTTLLGCAYTSDEPFTGDESP